MDKRSAGLLMYKIVGSKLMVFIVHPGGPFWKGKDDGAWSIPKGEVESSEGFLHCAIREMKEETGIDASKMDFIELGNIKQDSGKEVHCWAFEGDWSGELKCESFVKMKMKNGKIIKFPEVDNADFFEINIARDKINFAQKEFLDRLEEQLLQS